MWQRTYDRMREQVEEAKDAQLGLLLYVPDVAVDTRQPRDAILRRRSRMSDGRDALD